MERNSIPNVYFEELEPLHLLCLNDKKTTLNGFYNGFSIECPTYMKQEEKNRRLREIKEMMTLMKGIKKKPDYDESELADLLRKINRTKSEFVTENKFFGYVGKEDNTFNYGREILKGSLDDSLNVPYKKYAVGVLSNSSFSIPSSPTSWNQELPEFISLCFQE